MAVVTMCLKADYEWYWMLLNATHMRKSSTVPVMYMSPCLWEILYESHSHPGLSAGRRSQLGQCFHLSLGFVSLTRTGCMRLSPPHSSARKCRRAMLIYCCMKKHVRLSFSKRVHRRNIVKTSDICRSACFEHHESTQPRPLQPAAPKPIPSRWEPWGCWEFRSTEISNGWGGLGETCW